MIMKATTTVWTLLALTMAKVPYCQRPAAGLGGHCPAGGHPLTTMTNCESVDHRLATI